MDVGLRVLRAGLYDWFPGRHQASGRSFGVPPGGPFDLDAHGLANALVGNPIEAWTLEVTGFGGCYEATGPLAISLAGAPFCATIDRARGGVDRLTVPQSESMDDGDRLTLGTSDLGFRVYLATRGGWRGSRVSSPRLQAGNALVASPSRAAIRRLRPVSPNDFETRTIRILDGPEAPEVPIRWDNLVFRVEPASDRMGLRLSGPSLEVPRDPLRLSAPLAPGAIQWAGERWIVLGPDGGTMGGYPHLGHVVSADLGRLAQLRPGAEVRFQRVVLTEARRLDREDRCRRAERQRWIQAAVADEPPSLWRRAKAELGLQ